jgi:hypothetical protein
VILSRYLDMWYFIVFDSFKSAMESSGHYVKLNMFENVYFGNICQWRKANTSAGPGNEKLGKLELYSQEKFLFSIDVCFNGFWRFTMYTTNVKTELFIPLLVFKW